MQHSGLMCVYQAGSTVVEPDPGPGAQWEAGEAGGHGGVPHLPGDPTPHT